MASGLYGHVAMPRRPRICFDGATYHAMSRGNRKGFVFMDDRDRRRFLKIVAGALQRYGAICYAYCLMGNHYHLVICTPRGNVSFVMKRINGLYTQYVNWRYSWTGHVFEGRFKAIVIGDDIYLRDALAYVARNPLEAGLVADAGNYEWSSHRAVMGRCATPSFLTTDWLSSLCPGETLQDSRHLFGEIVSAPCQENFERHSDVVEGTSRFKSEVRSVIGATMYRAALPRGFRALGQPPLRELFDGARKAERRSIILRAHIVHGYRMAEIARYLDLHPTTISRIVNGSGSYKTTAKNS